MDDHQGLEPKQRLARFALRALFEPSTDDWDESIEPYGRFYDFGVRKRAIDPLAKRKVFALP